MRIRFLFLGLAGLVMSGAVLAQPEVQTPVTAIINARVFTMAADGSEIERGTIVIHNGRIESVGIDIPVPDAAEIIDAQGRIVTPGLISAASALGLTENPANDHTSDQQVSGGSLGAGFDVQYALNTNSNLVRLAVADGLTRAVTLPGNSGIAPFNGLGALLRLGRPDDLLEQPGLVLLAQLGGPTSGSAGGSRAAQWILLRQALDEARYWQAPAAGEKKALSVADLNSASLNRVVQGEIPLLLDVRRESDIRQAIRLQQDFDLRLVILGGSEAWTLADELAVASIPVILDPASDLPGTEDEWAVRPDAAAILHEAGVLIAIYPGSYLNYSLNAGLGAREAAGLAVANGLPYEAALRALTVNTAQIWGIADTAGSILPGREADLVIWDGDPLEPSSAPVMVMVKGRPASLETLQTRLRDRYWPPAEPGEWPPAYR
jgi:imidazolonepropionase-like amidohydrolase